MGVIAFMGSPAHGHVNPTLPVVAELVRRGEHVVYYDDEEFRAKIDATGAAFRAYPAGVLSARDISDSLAEGKLAAVMPALLRGTEKLLPFMLSELERERPDLAMFDTIAIWGRMAATQLKLPSVSSIPHFLFDPLRAGGSFGDFLTTTWEGLPHVPAMLAVLMRLSRAYPGAAPRERPFFPMRGDLSLMYTARALQPPTPMIKPSFRFVGPSIDAPTLAPKPRARPALYVSLGTVHCGDLPFYRACFEAFGAMDIDVILAVGGEDAKAALFDAPANFELMAWAPQLEVLQRVDVFLTHGGMNSLHEGLYFGVPLVVVPLQFEQMVNARIVARLGAATVLRQRLDGKQLHPGALRNPVAQVLERQEFKAAALRLRETLRATGGAAAAADEVQAFMARR